MEDIRTTWKVYTGDWQVVSPGLEVEDGILTAVIISLFTDRRADDNDQLPSGDDRRGWWGDILSDIEGDRIGSRLWLLSREKQLQSVINKAREYATESLLWMIEDGVASGVNVQAEKVRDGVLEISVEIHRPKKTVVKYLFEGFWEGI